MPKYLQPLIAILLAGCSSVSPAQEYRAGVEALERGQPVRARTHFVESLRLDPGLLEAHLNVAALDLAEGHAQEALTRLDGVVASGGQDDKRVRYTRAQALLELRRTDEAVNELEPLADAGFAEAFYALGGIASQSGDLGDAEFYLRKYLELDGDGGFSANASRMLDTLVVSGDVPVTDPAVEAPDPLAPAIDPEIPPVETVPVEQSPIVATEEPPKTAPVEEPVAEPAPKPTPPEPSPPAVDPKPQPKPQPKPETKPAALPEEERIWRDARFLEIKKKQYGKALETYRRYLAKYPFGPHADGAQEGIARCEAALAKG